MEFQLNHGFQLNLHGLFSLRFASQVVAEDLHCGGLGCGFYVGIGTWAHEGKTLRVEVQRLYFPQRSIENPFQVLERLETIHFTSFYSL